MKALVTADLHLTDNPRDEYRWNFMHAFCEIARRKKPEVIVIIGDLTEEKDHHGARLVNRLVRLMNSLRDIAPIIIDMGNHDYHNEGHPFFAFLSMMPNITWVDKPQSIHGSLFLPHTRNYKEEWKNVRLRGWEWVFAHQTFTGAEIGFGRGLEGIPLEVIPDDVRVIAGDVHKPQRLGPVTYVGPPYTVDFGDDYEPRLLLLEHGKAVSIKVGSHPQKRLIEIADISELSEASKHCHARDIVQLRVTVDNMSHWHETHKAMLDALVQRDLVPNMIKPVLMRKRKVKRYKVSTKEDDQELLEQYGKRHALTKNTMAVGRSLIDEA